MMKTILTGLAATLLAAGGALAQTADGDADASGDSNITTAAGSEGSGETNGAEPGEGATEPSAYESLSHGNQRIANALHDAQGASEGESYWDLDEIAAAKQDGTGWGEIFHQMKAEGKTDARNLGELMSGVSKHGSGATASETEASSEDGPVAGESGVTTGTSAASGAKTKSSSVKTPKSRAEIVITNAGGSQVTIVRGKRARTTTAGAGKSHTGGASRGGKGTQVITAGGHGAGAVGHGAGKSVHVTSAAGTSGASTAATTAHGHGHANGGGLAVGKNK